MKRIKVFGIASLFSEVLPREIFFYMVKMNLSYLDLKKLYRAFPTLGKSMKSIEEIPDDRYWIERPLLAERRSDVTELIAFILKPDRWADCDIVLSGSYLLYALEYDGISEPGWKYDDIDIFITIEDNSEAVENLIEDMFKKFETTPIYKAHPSSNRISRFYEQWDLNFLSQVMKDLLTRFRTDEFIGTKAYGLTRDVEFDFDGIAVHLIFAWKEMHGSAKDAVNEFDISICRNSYDGKKMEILCEKDIVQKVFRAHHREEESIGKPDSFAIFKNSQLTKRIKKHEKRGYVEWNK